ncbi:putative MFS family arabinose efflux permease [Curtobacterium sp. PhB130]|uniref:MFS transporter n=1 Tax=unclassified Curtobacterium TaxID=257496 RepID=UPI000F4C6554|nr:MULTISPECIES: MFS transporter [unclassified Curtobacterium]ROS71956.1 putative MFS family arabinose efflux permease [Curtobacterium sp. PhB130]TCK61374.1 putative MFS family arabinose efflux permease [Curtobacterium sp. PhB136]
MGDDVTTLRRVPGFRPYWSAATVSSFGSAVSAVAVPVLVVTVLHASPFEVGLVNAAQFLPYALFGLIVGAYVDRFRRKPLLIWASVGRGVCLGAIPVLWAAGLLNLWVTAAALFVFGILSVVGFAATQSLLPRIVPRSLLLTANARVDQSDAAAQTVGPALGGVLVSIVTAPVAVALDAVSYFVDAVLIARVQVVEQKAARVAGARLRSDIADGLRWTYGHATLAPLALSTHLWFLANAAGLTVFATLALRTLALPAAVYGAILAVSGVAMLLGATAAPRLGTRFGAGRTIIAARAAYPIAWAAIALTTVGLGVAAPPVTGVVLFVAFAVHGAAAGCENANEMSLRQTVTPDALLGRMNGTMRSANRTLAAAGAVSGGALMTIAGDSIALLAVTLVFTASVVVAICSPLRTNAVR